MICAKIHRSYRDVVALCDENLIGKKFEEGIRQLELRENFYKDKILTFEETVKLIQLQSKEDATFNIVGSEAIKAAKEAGIISKKNLKEIQGIPFTLVLV